MFNYLSPDPQVNKDLVEEHQRELLEEVEAEELAEGDVAAKEQLFDAYQPITDDEDDLMPTRRENRHVHKD